ncbi:DHS-like NAD/FAD-binding domain-containing protein [Epithele typhae]|uniref:DHS-like NAD/FAD-binding domain-containing protein n=1 Tax=Epithele typhae TaxID=378194 RepID=UPI00200882B1|nr:DHS-like NAD/FAD-binding domain-containing protein [Epithele typhae]KAH9913973.1 DHS-like NAD/FAD-binding domain-containing protein [Epithele typhae]
MRVSVPSLPDALLRPAADAVANTSITAAEATTRIADFLTRGKGSTAVITGAGVSVDSGIRAYRGKGGRYLNPNYKCVAIYHELMEDTARGVAFRCAWLRSFLGYPPVRDAQPNPTHYALAALQHGHVTSDLITQNVDGLHAKAVERFWPKSRIEEQILELHGTLHSVRCSHGHVISREAFQEKLGMANPGWKEYLKNLEQTGDQPRTNPDGDVVLPEGTRYDEFVVPECPKCLRDKQHNTMLKPEVVFFGESISQGVKERSFEVISDSKQLLVVGTTLATFSAFRLVKQAVEQRKPVLLLNEGASRADNLLGIEHVRILTSAVMRDVVRKVLGVTAESDIFPELLNSGIVKLPPEDPDDGLPTPPRL